MGQSSQCFSKKWHYYRKAVCPEWGFLHARYNGMFMALARKWLQYFYPAWLGHFLLFCTNELRKQSSGHLGLPFLASFQPAWAVIGQKSWPFKVLCRMTAMALVLQNPCEVKIYMHAHSNTHTHMQINSTKPQITSQNVFHFVPPISSSFKEHSSAGNYPAG